MKTCFLFFLPMFKNCGLVSQNANFTYMVRNKEYKKAVAQQSCVFEQRLKDKLSRKSAKQTKRNH